MEELVTRALDTVHLDWHDVLEHPLHHGLLLCVCPEAHVRLEVASPTNRHFSNVCKRRNVGRRGCRPVILTVIEEEQS